MIKLEEAQKQYDEFISQFQSVTLATVDENHFPNASYSPFYATDDKKLYVYISTMSAHTRNIDKNQKLSVMFIEDEVSSDQIFARKRLTFSCKAEKLEFESSAFEEASKNLNSKFGKIIDNFKSMADFNIFEITPFEGRFVIGFGAAYNIIGDDLNTLVHLGGGGHGHKKREGAQEESLEDKKAGMIEHMNSSHSDAVLNIVKYYAKESSAQQASLLDVQKNNLTVLITIDAEEREVLVPLIEPINNAGDAHKVLISMAKESREALENELVSENGN